MDDRKLKMNWLENILVQVQEIEMEVLRKES